MIELYDVFNNDALMLHKSLNKSGIKCPVVSLFENGYSESFIETPYSYFCSLKKQNKQFENKLPKSKPLYFNQIEIPQYWEISSSFNEGYIKDKTNLRGKIYYATNDNKRYVSVVDWMDEKGRVVFCDHYDNSGFKFAQSLIDENKQNILKIWYSKIDGKEKIIQNFSTNTVLLYENNKDVFFNSYLEFLLYYFKVRDFNYDHILLNSLYHAYNVSCNINTYLSKSGKDILFWNEKTTEKIPGNMIPILENNHPRIKDIYVQNFDSYLNINKNTKNKNMIHPLGYIYDFKKFKKKLNEVLILTNSDKIEKLQELVNALPNIKFNILARTQMSSELLTFGNYKNVELYPLASDEIIKKQLRKCSMLLDINCFNEIFDGVYNAFLNELVIFAFNNTMHNSKYTVPKLVFSPDRWQNMASLINTVATNIDEKGNKIENFYNVLVELQKKTSFAANKDEYKALIKKLQ